MKFLSLLFLSLVSSMSWGQVQTATLTVNFNDFADSIDLDNNSPVGGSFIDCSLEGTRNFCTAIDVSGKFGSPGYSFGRAPGRVVGVSFNYQTWARSPIQGIKASSTVLYRDESGIQRAIFFESSPVDGVESSDPEGRTLWIASGSVNFALDPSLSNNIGFSSIRFNASLAFVRSVTITYVVPETSGDVILNSLSIQRSGQIYGDNDGDGVIDIPQGEVDFIADMNITGFTEILNQAGNGFNNCLTLTNLESGAVLNYEQASSIQSVNVSRRIVFSRVIVPNTGQYVADLQIDCNQEIDDTNRGNNNKQLPVFASYLGDIATRNLDIIQDGMTNTDMDGDGIVDIKEDIPVQLSFGVESNDNAQFIPAAPTFVYVVDIIDPETNMEIARVFQSGAISTNFFRSDNSNIELADLSDFYGLIEETNYAFNLRILNDPNGELFYDSDLLNNLKTRLFKIMSEGDPAKLDAEVQIGQVFRYDTEGNVPELVQGKEADVLVIPRLAEGEDEDLGRFEDERVQIIVKEGENRIFSTNSSNLDAIYTLKQIRDWGDKEPIIFNDFDTNKEDESNVDITIELKYINREYSESDEKRNVSAKVFWTNSLEIGSFNFSACLDSNLAIQNPFKAPDPFYVNIINTSQKAIAQRLMPIRSNGLNILSLGQNLGDCNNSRINPDEDILSLGMEEDLLETARIKLASPGLNIAMGIGSEGYFIHHGVEKYFGFGIATPAPAIIINEKSSKTISTHNTLAHEIYHAFLGEIDSSNLNCCDTGGQSFSDPFHTSRSVVNQPYDADVNKAFSPEDVFNIMNPQEYESKPVAWVDQLTYDQLFEALRLPEIDPEIIIVSGFLDKNGNIELGKTQVSPVGVLLEQQGQGSFEVMTKNQNGEILDSFSYDPQFLIQAHPFGSLPIDRTPFAISLPFSPEVSNVEIIYNGEVKEAFNPIAYSLEDLIDNLTSDQIIGRKNRFKKKVKKLLQKKVRLINNLLEEYFVAKQRCESNYTSKRKGRIRDYFKKFWICKKSKILRWKLKVAIKWISRTIDRRINDLDLNETSKARIIFALDKLKEGL